MTLAIQIAVTVAAGLILAAPYWKTIVSLLAKASPYRYQILRVLTGVALVTVAWVGVPAGIRISASKALGLVHLGVGVTAVACALYLITGLAFNSARKLPAWVAEVLLLASGGLLIATTPLPRIPWKIPVISTVTQAVYVYEKDDTAVPPFVMAHIDQLNRDKKILATLLEIDTVDGTGQVPQQYKAAVDAARKATLPVFVTLSGSSVVKVVTVRDEKDLVQ